MLHPMASILSPTNWKALPEMECTKRRGSLNDVEAALDFALSQPGVQQVAAWGGSMGGAVSLMAGAQRTEIQAIVADSSFTSLEDEMAMVVKLPLLRPPIRFFAETEAGANISAVSPVEKIAQINPRPVMIIVGENDQSIPAQSG